LGTSSLISPVDSYRRTHTHSPLYYLLLGLVPDQLLYPIHFTTSLVPALRYPESAKRECQSGERTTLSLQLTKFQPNEKLHKMFCQNLRNRCC